MPIKFSIDAPVAGGGLEEFLEKLTYRAFDLMSLGYRAAKVMDDQNLAGALMGVDRDGNNYADLADYTIRHRSGSGSPLSPRNDLSWVVADFTVTVEDSGHDEVTVRGRWPHSSWLAAHIAPGGRTKLPHNMPNRNPVGMRPWSREQLEEEYREWIDEVLSGRAHEGPSGPPGSRGYTPGPRRGGGGGGGSPSTPSSSPKAGGASSAGSASEASSAASSAARPSIVFADDDEVLDFGITSGSSVRASSPSFAAAPPSPRTKATTPFAAPAYAATRFEHYGKDEASSMAAVRVVLGPDVTREQLAAVAGVPPEATRVEIEVYRNPFEEGKGMISVTADTPYTRKFSRAIPFTDGGPTPNHVINSGFYLNKSEQGRGSGTKMFAAQVDSASRAGFSEIRTLASRENDDNGYYTWARVGYDAHIPSAVRKRLPGEYAGLKKISDLMKTEGGRKVWLKDGVSVEMTFDIRPGSRSRRVLDAYVKEKGL